MDIKELKELLKKFKINQIRPTKHGFKRTQGEKKITKNIAQAEYDEEVDILYVHKDGNVKYSIDIDDTILDMGSRNRIIGVEVHNASKKFGIAIAEGLKISMKKVLKAIKKAFLKVSYGVNSFVVQIGFVAQVATKTVNEGLIIQAPIKKELLVTV